MSNVIKAYAIRYNNDEKRMVDITARSEALLERQLRQAEVLSAKETEEGFIEGLPGLDRVIGQEAEPDGETETIQQQEQQPEEELREELTEQLQKEMQAEAEAIITKAKAEAEEILKRAASEAEGLKMQLLERASKDGYAEGLQKAEAELQAEKERLRLKEEEQEENYSRQVSELEPAFAEVLIMLLQKLTGLCLENKKGIAAYLIAQAMKNCERSNAYLIKVAKEDFTEVEQEKQQLAAEFERPVQIEIVADPLLKKGECLIETDSRVIDCSLGTELAGLLEDIRLLTVLE